MNQLIRKIALCIGIIALHQISIHAQNEVDALRFSEIDWQGSARFMGAGRAFGAVGAVFSALNINPASIGLYKKSEITFTPMIISVYKNSSAYNGNEVPAQAVKYNLSSAGIVLAIPGIPNTMWKKFQIGFGYNRINNYNNIFSIEGRSNGSTIGYAYAKNAEGLDYKDINNENIWNDEMWLAYDYWLISPKQGSSDSYYPTQAGANLFHSSFTTQTGGNDEMIFSFGTNYDDKLFLGATLGVPFINFTENRTFYEANDKADTLYHFQYIKIADKLSVRTTGINLKLGVIYQPVDFVRVGLAFHTPTYYGNVKDYFERQINARKWEYNEDFFREYYNSPEIKYVNSFNYTLTTPFRATANVAFFIAQRAFISAEYEFAEYSMANMFSIRYNFREENRAIQNMYGFSHIARIGAELNISPVFAIRAGYNYLSSPYKNPYKDPTDGKTYDSSKHFASAGFGFKTKHFYGDFAYTFTTSKVAYWMYDAAFVNTVKQSTIMHRIMLSLGVRF